MGTIAILSNSGAARTVCIPQGDGLLEETGYAQFSGTNLTGTLTTHISNVTAAHFSPIGNAAGEQIGVTLANVSATGTVTSTGGLINVTRTLPAPTDVGGVLTPVASTSGLTFYYTIRGF